MLIRNIREEAIGSSDKSPSSYQDCGILTFSLSFPDYFVLSGNVIVFLRKTLPTLFLFVLIFGEVFSLLLFSVKSIENLGDFVKDGSF